MAGLAHRTNPHLDPEAKQQPRQIIKKPPTPDPSYLIDPEDVRT